MFRVPAMTSTFQELRARGVYPKKRLGQNFLVDENIASKIISRIVLQPGDAVVEIGPGIGALTEGLIETGAEIIAIEKDENLARLLENRFAKDKNIKVICGNALEFSYTSLAKSLGKKLKVVANLPYNISSPILFKLFENRDTFTTLLMMFQREVAERIVSGPNTKSYGILSVFFQLLSDVKVEFFVSPAAFYPVPKVDSSVVRFDLLSDPRVAVEDMDIFVKIVKAAFGRRRKTLLNALKVIGVSPEILRMTLDDAGIELNRRGETLDLEEFASVSNLLLRRLTT